MHNKNVPSPQSGMATGQLMTNHDQCTPMLLFCPFPEGLEVSTF